MFDGSPLNIQKKVIETTDNLGAGWDPTDLSTFLMSALRKSEFDFKRIDWNSGKIPTSNREFVKI